MRVIGTAGHVDHGKSTLIAALTGTHPDRLKEEQAREMTIDLGFAWLTLPDGEEVGIVDVPGHRDFIENMLSGIGGIDAALLVIAADEGVMPQTREHLAILDLLQIPAGLIILTKTDLAPDTDWLDLVEGDIRAVVRTTVMQDAPILRVSAKTKAGLESLVSHLETLLQQKPPRLDLNRPRLPIDRVFSMSGFGTVVTGTLLDGHLALGEEVEVLPSGHRGRIRGLQTHKKKEERAVPGSRTAVNISGLDTGAIRRGEVVARPGQYQPTRRLDAHLRLLPDLSAPLKHNSEVKFFVGASETMASLRLLGVEELGPGSEGWVQLELREPVLTVRGDRFILRRPSPGETLGGGAIVDHEPKGRHKRFDQDAIQSLELLAKGTPTDVLFEAALASNIVPLREVVSRSRLEEAQAEEALRELLGTGSLLLLEPEAPMAAGDRLMIALPHWNANHSKALQTIESYHKDYPLRRGIPREELKSRLQLSGRAFQALLADFLARKILKEAGNLIASPAHEVRFDNAQQEKIQNLMETLEANRFSPPGIKELQAQIGGEVLNALVEQQELVPVSQDMLFRKQDYDWMVHSIQKELQQQDRITLAEVRDLFHTSRKYAQAILEHLDSLGITIRDGDFRRLKRK